MSHRLISSPMPPSMAKRLTEIESSLIDVVKSNNSHNHVIADGREKVIVEEDASLMVDCMALPATTNHRCGKSIDNDVGLYDDDNDDEVDENNTDDRSRINIIAYCILSPTTLSQLQRDNPLSSSSSSSFWRTAGVKASRLSRPLHSVLRARCPSPEDVEFLIVDQFPEIGDCAIDERVDVTSSPRAPSSAWSPNQPQQQQHPKNQQILSLSSTAWSSISSNRNNPKHNNKHKNKIFRILTEKITSVLNIPPSQQRHLLTADANFACLGGDSMAAALVARGLYAVHFRIEETRHLGGRTGVLGSVGFDQACEYDDNDNGDGIDDDGWFFDTKYFLKCETLGEYVEFLEENGAFRHCHNCDDDVEYEETVERHDETLAPPGDDFSVGVSDQGDERLLQPERVDDDFDATNNSHRLYNHLMEAITLGHRNVALALLQYVDFDDTFLDNTATNNSSSMQSNVNASTNKARLGKISDRRQQRKIFQSNPLHLACIRGDAILVEALLEKRCKANVPNATGSFPIHLACSCRLNENRIHRSDVTISAKNSGDNTTLAVTQMETGRYREDTDRIKCVKLLLEAGTPISIKSGSKQTILHCAARSGHVKLLQFVMERWRTASEKKNGIKFRSMDVETTECVRDSDARSTSGSAANAHIFEWYDRWHRTPVHWAILNERVDALKILLDGGCSAATRKPKSGVKSSSILIETPLEMVSRLYGRKDGLDENSDPSGVGKIMKKLLLESLRGNDDNGTL